MIEKSSRTGSGRISASKPSTCIGKRGSGEHTAKVRQHYQELDDNIEGVLHCEDSMVYVGTSGQDVQWRCVLVANGMGSGRETTGPKRSRSMTSVA